MPPTQKGLVGSVTSQERIPFARESEITGGSCRRTRGDSATDGWCPHATCWRLGKSATKRTPRQRECQFTVSHKSQSRGQCAWVWVLGSLPPALFLFLLSLVFFFGFESFYYFPFHYTSRRCTLPGSCMLCAHKPPS